MNVDAEVGNSVHEMSRRVGDHYDTAANESCQVLGGIFGQYHVGLFVNARTLPEAQLALTDVIGESLQAKPGAAVLDVGCGVGGPACHLARHWMWNVTGVTISSLQTLQARQLVLRGKCQDRVRVIHADAHFLPFRNRSFEAAFGIESFAHFADKQRVLHEAARVLKPDGIVAIWDLVRREDLPADLYNLLHVCSMTEYQRAFEDSGFDPLRMEDLGRFILPPSMTAFIALLDSRKHADTIRCCERFLAAFNAGQLGYAIMTGTLRAAP